MYHFIALSIIYFCYSFKPVLSYRDYASFFFFFNDTATTEIYTLSLHDALPISPPIGYYQSETGTGVEELHRNRTTREVVGDRKSTRLNSSHSQISYAVFCLKKKKDTPNM